MTDEQTTQKRPALWFYVKDHYAETRPLSPNARSAWMDCICMMYLNDPIGELCKPLEAYARMFGMSENEASDAINELINMDICDHEDHGDKIRLISRRMKRDEAKRSGNRTRQQRHRSRSNGHRQPVQGEIFDAARSGNGRHRPPKGPTKPEAKCTHCRWQGNPDLLVVPAGVDDLKATDDDYTCCPKCNNPVTFS